MKLGLRFRVRTLLVAIALVAFASVYVGSYCRLSRRSMREANEYGLGGILYVPIGEAVSQRDEVWRCALARHSALALFYAPANWVDRQLFGGMPPVQCMLRLSG